MHCSCFARIFLLASSIVWLAVQPAVANPNAAVPAGVVVADFEEGLPNGARVFNAEVDTELVEGGRCIRLRPTGGEKNLTLVLPIAPKIDPARFGELAVRVRAGADSAPVRAVWDALDAKKRILFRRHFELKVDGEWHQERWSQEEWAWGKGAVGRWSDVRYLALTVQPKLRSLQIDDVQLQRTEDDGANAIRDLLDVAFNGRPVRSAEQAGLLVATDAVDALTDEDLRTVLGQMRRCRRFVQRMFGPAVRPIDTPTPPSMLIFSSAAAQEGFFDRLSERWGIHITPPTGLDGYTIQDIATAVYDRKYGANSLIFTHESFHAVLAHDTRLVPGNPAHSWLHEALASYLQLACYPQVRPPGGCRSELCEGRIRRSCILPST